MTSAAYAYLKIIPSLQGLGRHLRDQVRQAEGAAPKIGLAADLKTALLKEQLRAAAREGDQTAVRLLAELDAQPAETAFARMRARLGAQDISLKVVLDRSVGTSVRSLAQASSGIGTLTRELATNAGTVGVTTLRYGAMAGAVGGAAGSVGALGGAVATASGSLLALPAAGLAAVAILQTVRLGVSGLSDALKEEDPAKYAEAIREFPPAMAGAANAIRGARPEFASLRRDVQQRLFVGLASEITAMSTRYFPVLHRGLGGISSGLNEGAHGFTSFAREGRTVTDVGSILGNTSEATHELARAVRPLLEAFRDVASVGSGFLPGWASSLGDAAQRLAVFIAQARQSGQLSGWLSAGLSALGDLFTIIGNLVRIVGAVFSAANTAGGGLLSTVAEITGQILAFVQSAEGATALQQIFGGLHAIVSGLLPVLLAVGQAVVTSVAPAIAQLGPVLGQAFTALAPAIAPLGRILAALAPLLGAAAQALVAVLVPAVAALAPVIATLAPPLTQVVALLGAALGQAIVTLAPALLSVATAIAPLITGLGGLLVQAIRIAAPALAQLLVALAPIASQLGGALLDALAAVLPIIGQLAGIFGSVLLAALHAVMPVLPVIVTVIEQLAQVIGQALSAAAPVLSQIGALLGQILAQAITSLLPIVPPLAQAFLTVVAALLPILPPILQLVSALLPPLIGLVTTFLPLITSAAGLFAALASAVAPVVSQIAQFLIPIIQTLLAVVQPIFGALVSIISGAMRAIHGVIDIVMGLITGNWGRAWSGIKNLFGGIWDAIAGAVKNGVKFLLSLFVALPGRILGALGNLGGLLLGAGKNIIRGLVDGLAAGFGWVKDKLGELTNWIVSWKGPPARDRILLTANGHLIMGGLLDGLRAGEPAIQDYLTGLTDALPSAIHGTIDGGLSVADRRNATLGASAANTSHTAGKDSAGVTVVIDASGLDRHLTAWLRGAVHAQGGNVQIAFGH